ncbi:MAG TPA: ABC transporter permease [Candidatus Thermoplasmatota archaeon]|nr:ABC transporter permease [Candidatus Thermoplasmatota archaeon]
MTAFGNAVTDTMLLTKRNLLHYVRVPQLIAFAVIQPIMFTVLFVYVFGGAIATGVDYVNYLIPGIIVQTVVFGSMGSGINIAEDMQKGIMDRFRSLPIARGTVLAARTLTDTLRNALSVLIMAGVGYLMGYRFDGTLLDAAAALALCVLIGLAFSWIATFIGLMVRDTQTAEIAGFTWVFPVVFASSIFVPVESMPGWLAPIAEYNPITLAADAVRGLSLGPDGIEAVARAAVAMGRDYDPIDVASSAAGATLWSVGIIAVFAALAVWRFRRLA